MKDMPMNKDDIILKAQAAVGPLQALRGDAVDALAKLTETASVDSVQYDAHGVAWVSTYCEALVQLIDWASRLHKQDMFEEMEELILTIGLGEYLSQLGGGIP